MKVKRLDLVFMLWGQSWRGELWANSPSHARRNFIQEALNGPDVKNRLRVQTVDGFKEIVFFDRRFRITNQELWPDNPETFLAFARERLRQDLVVIRPSEAAMMQRDHMLRVQQAAKDKKEQSKIS